MKKILKLIILGFLVGIAAACASSDENVDATEIKGPAFVLFYTEN